MKGLIFFNEDVVIKENVCSLSGYVCIKNFSCFEQENGCQFLKYAEKMKIVKVTFGNKVF